MVPVMNCAPCHKLVLEFESIGLEKTVKSQLKTGGSVSVSVLVPYLHISHQLYVQ